MSVLNEKQDIQNEEDLYFNFINSIKSEVTKKIYENDVKYYLKFCNLTKLSDLLTIRDPQKQIINYIMSLRKRGLASNSISTTLNGIFHFYEMNDVILNKKKINIFKPEFYIIIRKGKTKDLMDIYSLKYCYVRCKEHVTYVVQRTLYYRKNI